MPIIGKLSVPRSDLAEAFREYQPEGQSFIATEVLPERQVAQLTAKLPVITRENYNRTENASSNGAAANRINLAIGETDYVCTKKRLEIALTDDDRSNYADDFDAELESVQLIKTKMMLEREAEAAAALFNTTTFTGSDLFTDVSGAPWDAAASDAIGHVLAAMEKIRKNCGYRPNALVIGEATLVNLLGNTGIKNRFPGAPLVTRAMIEQAMIAIFGLERLIVGSVVYNGAKEGQTWAGTDLWGDDYAMVCRINQGSTVSGGLGRTLVWNGFNTMDMVTQYREEQIHADIFDVSVYDQVKIFEPAFAHLLKVDA